MTGSPAFQFYPNDFLGSPTVMALSTEQKGIYLLLLCLDWNGDGFNFDEKKLAKCTNVSLKRFRAAWATLGGCFVVGEDGRYRNARLQRERAKQLAYSQRMSENGQKGGRPKAAVKPQLSPEKAAVKPNESIPFPSPTLTPTTTTKTTTSATKQPSRASWLLPASRLWESRFGEGSFPWGEFGKHLKPLSKAHDGPTIADHLGRYLKATDTQYVSPARFAKTFGEWKPVDANAIVDEFGCFTEYGEKVTRPNGRPA